MNDEIQSDVIEVTMNVHIYEEIDMYYLDTNALYWYYGREKLNMESTDRVDVEKLRKFLDGNLKKSLSSSAFIEAVVHFRNKPSVLKGLLRFIKERNFKIYNNVPYYGFDYRNYSWILEADEDSIKKYAEKLLFEKVEIEAKFGVVFLQIMIMLYLEHRLRLEGFHDHVYVKLLDFVGRRNLIKDEEKMKADLVKGYETGEEKKQLKMSYLELLEENYLFINMLVPIIAKGNDDSTDFVSEIQKIYQDFESDKAEYMLNSNSQNNFLMERIKSELSEDSDFLKEAKPKIADMFSKIDMTDGKKIFIPEQSRYIETVMFDAWIDRAKKIEKNDIFDMLFIGCAKAVDMEPMCILEDTSAYLLSFDGKIKDFIGIIKPHNKVVIDDFYTKD